MSYTAASGRSVVLQKSTVLGKGKRKGRSKIPTADSKSSSSSGSNTTDTYRQQEYAGDKGDNDLDSYNENNGGIFEPQELREEDIVEDDGGKDLSDDNDVEDIPVQEDSIDNDYNHSSQLTGYPEDEEGGGGYRGGGGGGNVGLYDNNEDQSWEIVESTTRITGHNTSTTITTRGQKQHMEKVL